MPSTARGAYFGSQFQRRDAAHQATKAASARIITIRCGASQAGRPVMTRPPAQRRLAAPCPAFEPPEKRARDQRDHQIKQTGRQEEGEIGLGGAGRLPGFLGQFAKADNASRAVSLVAISHRLASPGMAKGSIAGRVTRRASITGGMP